MNKIFLFLAITFLHLCTSSQAQFKHKLEFELGAVGNVHYLATPGVKPLTSIGGNYQRYVFPKTYIVVGLQGNTRNFSESSTDSLDMFSGSMKYNQWMASIGARHLFREEIIETFNYFAEASFHYSKINANGVYQGGRFGKDFYSYKKFRGVGFGFKFGAIYHFLKPWYLGANVGLYTTGGKLGKVEDFTILPETEPVVEELKLNESLTKFQFEIRIGTSF